EVMRVDLAMDRLAQRMPLEVLDGLATHARASPCRQGLRCLALDLRDLERLLKAMPQDAAGGDDLTSNRLDCVGRGDAGLLEPLVLERRQRTSELHPTAGVHDVVRDVREASAGAN